MIKQLTHEDYHSGLSAMGVDTKWYDMLNFRSINGRTRVVPRKFCLLDKDAGFHTIIQGLSNRHYVIGSKESFVQTNTENPVQFPLWHLTVDCSNVKDSSNDRTASSQQLLVRGNYTGSEQKEIDVTFVAGAPDLVVEEVTPTITPICYGCEGALEITLNGVVEDINTDEPISNATVELWQYGVLMFSLTTNALGAWGTTLLIGEYVLKIAKETYLPYQIDLSVTATDERVDQLTLTAEAIGVIDLFNGTNIVISCPGTPDHRCDAAVYKVYANNIFLGWAVLNNQLSGDPQATTFTLDATLAEQVSEQTNHSGILNLNVFADPTHYLWIDNSGYEELPLTEFNTIQLSFVWLAGLTFTPTIIVQGHGGATVIDVATTATSYICSVDLQDVYNDFAEDPIVLEIDGTWGDAGNHTVAMTEVYNGVQTDTPIPFQNGPGGESVLIHTITKDQNGPILIDPGHFDEKCHPHITNAVVTNSAFVTCYDGPIENLVVVRMNP